MNDQNKRLNKEEIYKYIKYISTGINESGDIFYNSFFISDKSKIEIVNILESVATDMNKIREIIGPIEDQKINKRDCLIDSIIN